MTVEFVYFDLGNVLLTFDNQLACRQMSERLGVPVEALCAFFQQENYPERLELGAVTAEEVYADLCRQFGRSCSLEAVKLAGSDMFRVNPGMIPLVTRLVAAGIPIGILSNTSAPHWEFVTDGRFRFVCDLFDRYALSFQIGAMKPADAIYAAATELAGCPGDRIFFTDDRHENVVAAQHHGWQAVPFQSAQQLARALRQAGLTFWY